MFANMHQTRLHLDCGVVRVSMMEDTVYNMAPLAFGIPMNNIVKGRIMIGGLLLSYGDCNKRALTLPRGLR